jgi:hypothetical protein
VKPYSLETIGGVEPSAPTKIGGAEPYSAEIIIEGLVPSSPIKVGGEPSSAEIIIEGSVTSSPTKREVRQQILNKEISFDDDDTCISNDADKCVLVLL